MSWLTMRSALSWISPSSSWSNEPVSDSVSAVADNFEVRDVLEVHISEDRGTSLSMLFDAGRSLEERVLAEQFSA